jgi:hypothetical protein
MAYQISKLRRFIAENPALADVPFITVRGMPLTPRQALAYLERGEMVSEIVAAMAAVGFDPNQEWQLAEAYYQGLLRLPPPRPKIIMIGQELTLEEALQHIKLRDQKGQELLQAYQGLRREMARRMR